MVDLIVIIHGKYSIEHNLKMQNFLDVINSNIIK